MTLRPLVVALGSPMRRDDAAAIEVAAALLADGCEADVVLAPDVLALPDLWAGRADVVVVDAVASGAPAGTVHAIDVTGTPLPAGWRSASTHQIGLGEVIELARELDRLPLRVTVVGIEGERFEPGLGLTPAVAAALDRAAVTVRDTLPHRASAPSR